MITKDLTPKSLDPKVTVTPKSLPKSLLTPKSLTGGVAYFGIAEVLSPLREIDKCKARQSKARVRSPILQNQAKLN